MKPSFRADYIEVAATVAPANPTQLPARLAGAHQVSRAFFTLRASTWALVDQLRGPKNLTASEYLDQLILKASRAQ